MELINLEQLQQMEYLLTQSSIGNHILFDMNQIKKVFSAESEIKNEPVGFTDFKKIEEVRKIVEALISQPTLTHKKAFVNSLSENAREMLIRAYFNILDNALYQNNASIH